MRIVTTSASLLALLALVAAGPGCTSDATDEPDQSEDQYRVKPKDNEALTRLTIATPAGWTLPVNPAEDATASYRGGNVPLNVAQRLTEGPGDVYVSSKFDMSVHAGTVTLAKGKQTTFALGSLKPTYDAKTTIVRDFGPAPALKVFYTPPGGQEAQVWGQSRSNPTFWSGSPARALLAPPGAYRFSWSLPILADVSQALADGENVTVALTPSDQRATILVKKPAARELPDVPMPQCHLPTQTFIVHRRVDNAEGRYGEPASYDQRNTSMGNVALQDGYNNYSSNYDQVTSWAALPMKADTAIRVFPFASSEGQNHYEVVVNNVAMALSLKPGDTKTIRLERLDVDDVEVTKETGEVYMVRGNWTLFRQGPNNSWIPITVRQDCSAGAGTQVAFPTNAGLDVVPGTYRLLINYSTAEGAKQQDQTITIP